MKESLEYGVPPPPGSGLLWAMSYYALCGGGGLVYSSLVIITTHMASACGMSRAAMVAATPAARSVLELLRPGASTRRQLALDMVPCCGRLPPPPRRLGLLLLLSRSPLQHSSAMVLPASAPQYRLFSLLPLRQPMDTSMRIVPTDFRSRQRRNRRRHLQSTPRHPAIDLKSGNNK
jgi:hypothetical protein